MTTRGELIAGALESFLQNCPDVDGAAVVTPDGLPMASAVPERIEEERLAAMSAALVALGDKAARTLGKGSMRQLFIEGEGGFVYVKSAGDAAVLCAICRPSAKTGLIVYEMKAAAEAVSAALGTSLAPRSRERLAEVPAPESSEPGGPEPGGHQSGGHHMVAQVPVTVPGQAEAEVAASEQQSAAAALQDLNDQLTQAGQG